MTTREDHQRVTAETPIPDPPEDEELEPERPFAKGGPASSCPLKELAG